MVYIHGDDSYCRACGKWIGRRKMFKKRGHEFCDLYCFEMWQVDTFKVVDLTVYRSAQSGDSTLR